MSFGGNLIKLGMIPDRNGGFSVAGKLLVSGGLVSAMGRGKVFYVDPANGADQAGRGKSPDKAFATLAYGYTKLTANQNDTLVLIGNGTGATITDTLIWAKNYTHLVGVCASAINKRARITVSGTDSTTAGLVVSASGCIFENFRIYQGTSLAGIGTIEVTGGRNTFNNIDILGVVGASALASATAYALKLNGAEENRFMDCYIGIDTAVRTASQILLVDGAAVRNEFDSCHFVSASETAANVMVKINDTTAIDRWLRFKGECLFSNFSVNHANVLTECISVPASTQTHDIIIGPNCMLAGITEWEANDRGQMWIGAPTGAAATQGIGVEPAT